MVAYAIRDFVCTRSLALRCMHELIEGLQGIEVIADDFVIVRYNKTQEEATVTQQQFDFFSEALQRTWS